MRLADSRLEDPEKAGTDFDSELLGLEEALRKRIEELELSIKAQEAILMWIS